VFVCHVSLCYVSLVLDICCVLYVGFISGVLQCGLLRTVFICWGFSFCSEVWPVFGEGSVVGILGKAGVLSSGGLWGWGFMSDGV